MIRSLLKAAEEVHLPKALRQEFGGGFKEFVGSEANCFEGSDDETRFFTTQERQSLVLHLLHTLRAGPHDLHSLSGLKMVEGQAIVPKCISAGIISQVRYNRSASSVKFLESFLRKKSDHVSVTKFFFSFILGLPSSWIACIRKIATDLGSRVS